jgi:hypothetical protein
MKSTGVGDRSREGEISRGVSGKALIVIEAFVGLGAVGGGVALMLGPKGSILPLPTSLLNGSPFADYFVPGVLLTLVVGGGMLGAAVLLGLHRPYALEVAMVTGAALVIFEVVEFSIIGFNPLQVLYGGLGAVVLGVATHHGGWLCRAKDTMRWVHDRQAGVPPLHGGRKPLRRRPPRRGHTP